MSVIIANSIRNSDSVAPNFDNIRSSLATISSVVCQTATTNSIFIGSNNIYVQIVASPTVAYKITIPAAAPTGLQYFGYTGSAYGWLTPALAGVSTAGINNIICTTGSGFAALSPATVLQNIGAQPQTATLSAISATPLISAGIFGTTATKAATMLSYTQLLTALGLASTNTPTFAGLTIAQISAPAGKLQAGCEILALPGTTPSSLATIAQLSSIATGNIQLAPAAAYYTAAGTYANNQITAAAYGPFTADGMSPALGARILVNTSVAACGIYTVTTLGTSTVRWQLSRTNEPLANARLMMLDGAAYVGSSWIYSADTGVFTQDGPSVAIIPGAGISVTGRQVGITPVIAATTLANPTNITVNTYGQIISATSRSVSQTRADLDLVSPTFAAVTIGPVSLNAAGATYTLQLPTTPPNIGNTMIYSGTSLEWGTVQSTLTGIRATVMAGYIANGPGGIAAINTWTVYPLNTIMTDTTGTTTISNNAVTIPAGTFNVSASASFCQVGGCVIRLRDTTNMAVLLQGTSAYSANGAITIDDGAVVRSAIIGQIVVITPIRARLEYYASTSSGASYELGRNVTSGNLYGYLQIVSVTDIVAASTDTISTGTIKVSGAITAQMYKTSVCMLNVSATVVLPPNYRTYFITGSAGAMFMITPPTPADGLEIIIVNTTGFGGIFTTVYGSYSVANYTKQIFTYVAALNGWI